MPTQIGRQTYPEDPAFNAKMTAFFRQQFPNASPEEIASKVAGVNASMDAPRVNAAAQAIPQIPVNPAAWEKALASFPRAQNIIDLRPRPLKVD